MNTKVKATDPKIPDKKDELLLTKKELFLEAVRLTEPKKKQEYNKLEEDITNLYYFLQKLAKKHNLI